jgi:hypothetical protein
MNKINQFNAWLANILGNSLSSMYFFYFCIVLDLIELGPVIAAHNVVLWVTYLSQSVIQLVALPILGAQNKLQQDNHTETIKHIKRIHQHFGIGDDSLQNPSPSGVITKKVERLNKAKK